MKRAIAILLLAIILATAAGCSGTTVTLYESAGLKIDRGGAETTIEDKNAGSLYTLHTVRIRRQDGTTAQIKTLADTDTIKISAGGGLLIVTDKINGQTVYLHRHHR